MKFYGHEIVDHNRLTFGVEISGIDLDSIKPEDFTTLVVEHVMSNVGVEGFAIGEEFYDVDLKIVEIEHGEWDLTFHVMATATKKDETL